MKLLPLLALPLVTLLACGTAPKPPTASSARQSTKSGAQSLKAKKPATTTTSMQAPKPTLPAKSGGSRTVTPRDITSGGTVSVETWSFSDVDLDGDGALESGVVAVAGDELAAWWSGAFYVEEEQTTVPYEAMLWTEGGGVGFIFDFGESAIACGADAAGAGGCIVCDASGVCSEQ